MIFCQPADRELAVSHVLYAPLPEASIDVQRSVRGYGLVVAVASRGVESPIKVAAEYQAVDDDDNGHCTQVSASRRLYSNS